MSKTIYTIHDKNKKISAWEIAVSSWIEKFVDVKKSEGFLIINDIKELTTKDVILVGNNLNGNILKTAKKLIKNGCNVNVITNLCSDVSYEKFNEGIANLIKLGVHMYRDFEFMKDEIEMTLRNSLELTSGRKSDFSSEVYFINLHYDSLDLMNLIGDIEDTYYTHVPKKAFGKIFKVKELYKVLECGYLPKTQFELK